MFYQLLINSIISTSIYSLIALGFIIIYRTIKFFHFAHGVVYTAGAYFAYTFYIILHWNFAISIILAVILSSGLGLLIDRIVYLPLRKKNSANLIYLLASFGVFILLENLIALIFGNQILTLRTGEIKEGYQIFGAVITEIQIYILITAIVLMILLWLFIKKTKYGKAMRAVADNPLGANIAGINSDKIIMLSFVIGSALAGIAGILVSFETNIEPTMGFSALLKGIIACIVGGITSIPGAVLGAFLLGFAENFGIWQISAGWKDCISFGILILFLLLRPQGIFGRKKDL